MSPEFDARFSDGRTAASQQVRVRISKDALIIDRGHGASSIVWPLKALETSEPVSSASVDVLVHEPGRAGATLFVAESAFVRALAARAPYLTARSQRWRSASPWVGVAFGIVALAVIVAGLGLSPAQTLASMLPDSTRQAIGKQVIKSMGGSSQVCTEAAGVAALDALGKRLSDASGGKKKFAISVIDRGVVNAFAAPGEEIIIMRGLINRAESADEVAGVLAHEMGHGIELHPEAGIIRIVGLTAITEFVLGGSGGTIANLGLALTQLSYSRVAEREADAQALKILKNAGISTRGISDFFRRMAKTEEKTAAKSDGKPSPSNKAPGPFDFLSTHPSSAERLAAIGAQPTYPATPALTDDQWQALKRICGAPAATSPSPGGDGPPARRKPPAPERPQPAPRTQPPTRDGPRDI